MPRDRKRVDVLVIGAGAAGLAAARDLSQAGLRVTVVEARQRIGGRILTLHDPRSPVPYELGAEFIHGEAIETLSMARAAGLAVLELPDTHELASAGRFRPMGDFWEIVDRMNHDLARRVASRGKDFPVSDYLDSARIPGPRRGMLEDFVQGFYAAHPERLSAKSLAVEEGEIQGKQFRIANGGDALMKWLRDGLDPDRTQVRLSTVVDAIEWSRAGVRVSCRGSDRAPLPAVSARTAVVTVPAAVLKTGTVRFDPPLPDKQRALAGIETGQIFKIVLRFREAFWEKSGFLKERRAAGAEDASLNFLHAHGTEVPTWWSALPVRAPVLIGYVGAVAAEQLLSEEPASRLERSLVALSEVLAVPRRELEELLDASASHDWRADPFARGAYSYIGVGGIGAPRTLGRPVQGKLFFAGEATNGEEIGTVAGALSSGRRAAREVLRVLQWGDSTPGLRMPVIAKTVVLLVLSNIFMTFAWYAHLRHLSQRPWIIAALVSWGIALFEYLLQVPANRIGHTQLQIGQLKILQEVITLSVFVPFATFYMKEPVRLNYLWAGLCMCGAVFFMFRR